MPRYWFEKLGNADLLQVQQDRIIHNWRKNDEDTIYPRYETVRDTFKHEVNEFVRFLKDENLGDLRPNQCEVSYNNVIPLTDSEKVHQRLQEISPLWTGQFNSAADETVELESTTVQMRLKMMDAGRPFGRVYLSFQPALLRSDPSKQVFRLDITARGRPSRETVEGAFEFFDLGRRTVVKTFAAVTKSSMHSVWGRTDANG
jgi:uncharacterized protein (TIGR04255 family)